MIALRVADVDALNQHARRRLLDARMLAGPAITAAGRTFQVGDRVVARRNQQLPTIDGASARAMNGQRGTITAVDSAARAVTVGWDGRTSTIVPAGYLDAGHLDHGYAITGHRAQGLTVDETWVQTSDALYREWGYVAASRGRRHNQLYGRTDSEPVAHGLDHGAWQRNTATASERLRSQLGRSHAHQTATDMQHSNPPALGRNASDRPTPPRWTDQADLGLD